VVDIQKSDDDVVCMDDPPRPTAGGKRVISLTDVLEFSDDSSVEEVAPITKGEGLGRRGPSKKVKPVKKRKPVAAKKTKTLSLPVPIIRPVAAKAVGGVVLLDSDIPSLPAAAVPKGPVGKPFIPLGIDMPELEKELNMLIQAPPTPPTKAKPVRKSRAKNTQPEVTTPKRPGATKKFGQSPLEKRGMCLVGGVEYPLPQRDPQSGLWIVVDIPDSVIGFARVTPISATVDDPRTGMSINAYYNCLQTQQTYPMYTSHICHWCVHFSNLRSKTFIRDCAGTVNAYWVCHEKRVIFLLKLYFL
jgi:hypothetical protein